MAGQPTKYTEELVEQAREYLNNLPEDEAVHSIEGLADYVNISRQTVYNWLEDDDKPIFFDIVEKVLLKQAKSLANNALLNRFNATIAKLMLTKHGYHDKSEVDQKTKVAINFDDSFNDTPLSTEIDSQESSQV